MLGGADWRARHEVGRLRHLLSRFHGNSRSCAAAGCQLRLPVATISTCLAIPLIGRALIRSAEPACAVSMPEQVIPRRGRDIGSYRRHCKRRLKPQAIAGEAGIPGTRRASQWRRWHSVGVGGGRPIHGTAIVAAAKRGSSVVAGAGEQVSVNGAGVTRFMEETYAAGRSGLPRRYGAKAPIYSGVGRGFSRSRLTPSLAHGAIYADGSQCEEMYRRALSSLNTTMPISRRWRYRCS